MSCSKVLALSVALGGTLSLAACQSPTSATDTIAYADTVTVTSTPDPIVADSNTGGRTYRVVRGNNQADEILPYDWHAVFATTVTMNSNASNKDIDIDWPIKITATQVSVKQASAGIVTPPTGSEEEHSEFVTLGASANAMSGVGSSATLTWEIWYDLPSLRKEAVVQIAYWFTDADGTEFSKTASITVAP